MVVTSVQEWECSPRASQNIPTSQIPPSPTRAFTGRTDLRATKRRTVTGFPSPPLSPLPGTHSRCVNESFSHVHVLPALCVEPNSFERKTETRKATAQGIVDTEPISNQDRGHRRQPTFSISSSASGSSSIVFVSASNKVPHTATPPSPRTFSQNATEHGACRDDRLDVAVHADTEDDSDVGSVWSYKSVANSWLQTIAPEDRQERVRIWRASFLRPGHRGGRDSRLTATTASHRAWMEDQ